jgi:nicotinamidase-related amidase
MPANASNLHGDALDNAEIALLLIDVINDLDFPNSKQLLRHALPMAERIAALKRRAKAAGIPTVYVHDNFGRWQSNFRQLVEHCLQHDVRGQPIVELLQPTEEDYFVLKPKHSGFFSTTLELLLEHLGARTLILTGLAGNICVLFTANDADMRGFSLIVPPDCVASNTRKVNQDAIEQMRSVLKAKVASSRAIRLPRSRRTKSKHNG